MLHRVAALGLGLLVSGCESAPPKPSHGHVWKLTQESPIERVCIAPCSATFRLWQVSGPASCPSVVWRVTDFDGRQVFRQGRDGDCRPGDPTPRYRFLATFQRGTWVVWSEATVEGQLVAKPWRELEVR